MTPFATILTAKRRRQGWTQLRLAVEAGLHKGTVANYELGMREPTWEAVQQLAAALGCPVTDFATQPAPPKTKPKPARKAAAKPVKRTAKVKRK